MNYYIGIDIGTTSVKAVAFAENGDIVGRETIEYSITHPQANYSEQDPDQILEAVVNSLSRLSLSVVDGTPLLISFSAAMHSVMAVNEAGEPITRLIIWADNRAAAIAEKLKETDTGRSFYHKTGVPVHAMSPFCKLLWLQENNPALFSGAWKFVGIKEYIFYKFFGRYISDTAMASATGLLNIHTLEWENDILEYAHIKRSQLPELVTGTHKEYLRAGSQYFADERCKRITACVFVAGGSDGALANLGSHAVSENSMAITIGTSAAVRLVSAKVVTDIYSRTFCYCFGNRDFIIGGASSNGGIVLQWLKDTLLQTRETYDELFEQAEKIAPACNGLLFIPYILGERAPVWNSSARGVFFGLDISHTRAHLIRSALEAVVYSVYSIGKILMEARTVTEIHVTGGFTQNALWVQMLCDMFNCTVLVSGATEGSATGAVMVGLEALGIKQTWQPKITEKYQPNPVSHAIYLGQFEKFERIYQLLKSEMGSVTPGDRVASN